MPSQIFLSFFSSLICVTSFSSNSEIGSQTIHSFCLLLCQYYSFNYSFSRTVFSLEFSEADFTRGKCIIWPVIPNHCGLRRLSLVSTEKPHRSAWNLTHLNVAQASLSRQQLEQWQNSFYFLVSGIMVLHYLRLMSETCFFFFFVFIQLFQERGSIQIPLLHIAKKWRSYLI